MKFPKTRLTVLAIAIMLVGCDSSGPRTQSTTPLAKPHYQRFLPISPEPLLTEGIPWHGYFALDTKTGTLCSTIKGRAFKGAAEWANDVPSCEQLLAANPE
jgi:hypothetical protein